MFAELLHNPAGRMPWDVQREAFERLPALLKGTGFPLGVAEAKKAVTLGRPALLLATWSPYGLALLDELVEAGAPDRPAVLDVAVFGSPEEAEAAWSLLSRVRTLPAVVLRSPTELDASLYEGVAAARDALKNRFEASPTRLFAGTEEAEEEQVSYAGAA